MVYWGKVIGTLAGMATLKPWFALLGLFIGHQFDRGFAERYRNFEQQGAAAGHLSVAQDCHFVCDAPDFFDKM